LEWGDYSMNKSPLGDKKISFKITIVVEPDDGGFHAFCPALKGLHVDGTTEKEALENAREAAVAYLVSLIKHGDPIPLNVVTSEVDAHSQSTQYIEQVPVLVPC